MSTHRPRAAKKKYFTAEQANKMLPLVRSIVRDIVELAADIQRRQAQLVQGKAAARNGSGDVDDEEGAAQQMELARDAARIEELVDELRELGVELKGWDGLVDFPCWMGNREVYLCWKLDEPEVAHWHEIDAGFAGRQKLSARSEVEADVPITAQRGQ